MYSVYAIPPNNKKANKIAEFEDLNLEKEFIEIWVNVCLEFDNVNQIVLLVEDKTYHIYKDKEWKKYQR